MTDNLTFAQTTLSKGNFTLVLYNGKETISSYERGVKPLISLYDRKEDYSDFSAADKVVGKAAAYLYVLLGVTEVFAQVISRPALEVLHRYEITVTYDEQVPAIRNRTNSGFCPMESAVMDIADAGEAYMVLKRKLDEI